MTGSISTFAVILFWISAALMVHTYVVYPVLVVVLSRLFGRIRMASPINDQDAPTISLLIVAHNEEAVMQQRINNALAVDYPRDSLEIVVASDGSSDVTAAIVRRHADRGVRLIEFAERRGKAAVLNRVIPQLQSQIIVLSDANTDMDPSAVRKLVRWFHDPNVGVVCGRLVITDPRKSDHADSLYWRYETMLKQCESRLGALLGANGAIYAIRRSVYAAPPDGTIVDDLVIPLLARIRSGCTIVYDVEAVAREESAPDMREEFRRRSRIGSGDYQSLGLLWPLLNPRWGFTTFSFVSHKVLRWLCPFFLMGLMAGSLLLWNQPFYRMALLVQLALYIVAGVAVAAPRRFRLPKFIRLATMFVTMNAALLTGFLRWVGRSRQGMWEPTTRSLDKTEAAGTHER